jgi:hypothetical protein
LFQHWTTLQLGTDLCTTPDYRIIFDFAAQQVNLTVGVLITELADKIFAAFFQAVSSAFVQDTYLSAGTASLFDRIATLHTERYATIKTGSTALIKGAVIVVVAALSAQCLVKDLCTN